MSESILVTACVKKAVIQIHIQQCRQSYKHNGREDTAHGTIATPSCECLDYCSDCLMTRLRAGRRRSAVDEALKSQEKSDYLREVATPPLPAALDEL
jgi:hypothetical protein